MKFRLIRAADQPIIGAMTITAITLEELGQTLRDVRQGQKRTLEQVAKELRIRPVYLEALESGDWRKIPAQTYGRGYLRQYAAYLGMKEEEVMEICDQLQEKVAPRLHYYETNPLEQTPSRRVLTLIAMLMLAVLIGWYVTYTPQAEYHSGRYALPPRLAAEWEMAAQGVPVNLPRSRMHAYPAAAQECMKILSPPRNPCYYAEAAEPVLARRESLVISNW